MASLPKKISKPDPQKDRTPTFEKSIVYSLVFHLVLILTVVIYDKINGISWRKPPVQASVVWTQAVKRPTPTIPDKLPPPLVPMKKPESPKSEEINISKKPAPAPEKKKEESREDKMKKALEKLQKNVPEEDDRPTPKEDNFPTANEKQPEGTLSDTEILAIQASPVYSAYLKELESYIKSNFFWYKAGPEAHISMKIDAQGNLSNIKIEQSSGNFSYDQAALRAVQKSNPVPPPPAQIMKYFVQEIVQINFRKEDA